jgi:hypothetical protein
MASTAMTLAVLLALFLVGIKWTIDVVRERPRKKLISSHFTLQRSGRHLEHEHGRLTAQLDRVGNALAVLKEGKTIKTRMLSVAAWWDERKKRKSEQ